MTKWMIFDFDGTLVDSKDIMLSAYNKIAQKHGYKPILLDNLDHLRSIPIKDRCKLLGFSVWRLPFLANEFYIHYKDSIKNLILFDGIKGILDTLHQKGIQVGIISSNSEKNIREFLERNQINYIHDVLGSNKIFGKHKMIQKFIKKRNIDPHAMLYVGDEHRDIIACKKCGVRVIWVSWGYDLYEHAKEAMPDFIVNRPEEILNIEN